jgi:uncharacterized protein
LSDQQASASPPPTVPPPGAPPVVADDDAAPLDERERSLDRRVVPVWRLLALLSALPPLGVVTAAGFLWGGRGGWPLLAVAVTVVGALVGWLPRARYRRWRWRLGELALELRHGVLVHQQEAVPYFRIQQIDVTQGPLDRLLGLATLQVTTASASGSVGLPGIAATDAPRVRAELVSRAAAAVADEPGDVRDAV